MHYVLNVQIKKIYIKSTIPNGNLITLIMLYYCSSFYHFEEFFCAKNLLNARFPYMKMKVFSVENFN
jgi:hypothetical protein